MTPMTPLRFLGLFASGLVTFLALDLLWLGVVARGFYANQLGPLMRPDVQWGAAFLFYAIYVLGVVVLAVLPALEAGSLTRAAGLGALLGLVAYAAYDLTNLATLAGFPPRMVPVDLIWGTVLTAAVASVTFMVGRWMALG